MKKTTKFLLVLAAVVAMTIGAVSTVMAADDVIIAKWIDNGDKGWAAKDADGASITRGWAKDGASGIYYYFKDGVMQTNTFVTSSNKIYYVGSEGAMHTGWLEFTDDMLVTYNGAKDVTVAEAFADRLANKATIGSDDIEALTEKTQYETVWMYFDEATGVLAMNQWTKVNGIYYYMDGPFCLISDWSFYVAKDKATYGFDESGAMIAGWAHYYKATDTTQNSGKPYEKPGQSKDSRWVYYEPNGKKAGEGWLKDDDGNWFFMKKDAVTGVSAVTNKFVEMDGYVFYFNDGGYLVSDSKTFNAPSNKDLVVEGIKVTVSDGEYSYETVAEYLKVAKNGSVTYKFKGADGSLLTGLQGSEYYEDGKGTKYTIKVETLESTTGSAISVTANKEAAKVNGQQWTNDFLYVDKDGNVFFFDNGVMVKNEAVVVGKGLTLAFDKDGKLVGSKAQVIGGVKYVASTEDFLATGIPYSVVTK